MSAEVVASHVAAKATCGNIRMSRGQGSRAVEAMECATVTTPYEPKSRSTGSPAITGDRSVNRPRNWPSRSYESAAPQSRRRIDEYCPPRGRITRQNRATEKQTAAQTKVRKSVGGGSRGSRPFRQLPPGDLRTLGCDRRSCRRRDNYTERCQDCRERSPRIVRAARDGSPTEAARIPRRRC